MSLLEDFPEWPELYKKHGFRKLRKTEKAALNIPDILLKGWRCKWVKQESTGKVGVLKRLLVERAVKEKFAALLAERLALSVPSVSLHRVQHDKKSRAYIFSPLKGNGPTPLHSVKAEITRGPAKKVLEQHISRLAPLDTALLAQDWHRGNVVLADEEKETNEEGEILFRKPIVYSIDYEDLGIPLVNTSFPQMAEELREDYLSSLFVCLSEMGARFDPYEAQKTAEALCSLPLKSLREIEQEAKAAFSDCASYKDTDGEFAESIDICRMGRGKIRGLLSLFSKRHLKNVADRYRIDLL